MRLSCIILCFFMWLSGKELLYNAGDIRLELLISGSARSPRLFCSPLIFARKIPETGATGGLAGPGSRRADMT